MKGRKMGPGTSGPAKGDKDWDHEQKPVARNKAPKIMAAAKARKDGGKASGDAPMKNGGRMPRKSGGRTGGSNMSPFSSARTGNAPAGRKTDGSTQ